jgi:serine/threonine-protein kinase
MIRLLALLLLGAGLVPAAAETYRAYANERFGATADVPASWRAGPPPANGDGLIFRSPDGNAALTVSGSLNIADSVDEAMRDQATPNDGENVTYSKAGKRDVTISGTKGDRIFYRKSILVCGDQVWNSIHLEYPARDKKAYDALVTHVARSLRGGRSEQIADCR